MNCSFICYGFLSVTVTSDGLDSVIRLANGDMRKSLNILQASNYNLSFWVFLSDLKLSTNHSQGATKTLLRCGMQYSR